MSNLDAILAGEDADDVEVSTETTETVDEHETESVDTETTGEEEAASPVAEETSTPAESVKPDQAVSSDRDKGMEAAILAERRKRQEAENRARQYEEMLNQQKEKPDFWADPDAAIDQRLQAISSQFDNRFLNMSEQWARQRHEDFEDISSVFFDEMVQENPALASQAKNAPDPYEWIYQTASKYRMMKEVGSLDKLREKIRAEERARVEAEIRADEKARIEAEINRKSELTGTLSNAPATGGNKTPRVGRESLHDVLGR